MAFETAFQIDFEESDHIYRLDGKRVDSVTQILKQEGFIDTRWYKPSGTNRGSLVHEATECIDTGTMTANMMIGSELYPYLAAYEQFRSDNKMDVALLEKPAGSLSLRYAGTVDRVFQSGEEYHLYDIKSGAHELWHGLQLAAYKIALEETYGIKISRRRVVHLKNTGKYSLCEKDKNMGSFDLPVWEEYWKILCQARMIKKRWAKVGHE